jgi:hypothetical protein
MKPAKEEGFYKYTFSELVEKIGPDLDQEKATFYVNFLQRYTSITCLKKCRLLTTYVKAAV